MKLYATTTSERASKGQGGNEYIRIHLMNEKKRTMFMIDYSEAGLRLSAPTDTGGVILYETKGEKKKDDEGVYCKEHKRFYKSDEVDPCDIPF